MSTARDSFWRRVLADHRPRPVEMAAAESQMRGATAATRLPRRRGSVVLVAALATCALGFVGTQVHWPTTRAPVLVLTCAEAMALATDAETESQRFEAFAVVESHCLHGLRAVLALAADPEPSIARRAQAILGELRAETPTAHSQPSATPAWELTATAKDRTQSIAARCAALTELHALLGSGLLTVQNMVCAEPMLARKVMLMRRRLHEELFAVPLTEPGQSADRPKAR